jgi:hypothetical protein
MRDPLDGSERQMQKYEAWSDPANNSVSFGPASTIQSQREQGLLSPSAVLLHRIEAATWEEANAIHSLRMGEAPYTPLGEPAPCPKCSATYYPHGSGQCWRCGFGS